MEGESIRGGLECTGFNTSLADVVAGDLGIRDADTARLGSEAAAPVFNSDMVLFLALGTKPSEGADAVASLCGDRMLPTLELTTDTGRDTGADRSGDRERGIELGCFTLLEVILDMDEELILARTVIVGATTPLKGDVPDTFMLL